MDKYAHAAAASQATHLPFAVKTMGGLSESALQLMRDPPLGKHTLHMEGRGCHRLLHARQRGHRGAEEGECWNVMHYDRECTHFVGR